MHTKTKLLSISTLVSAALFLTLSAAQASVERTQAPNGARGTKIKVNGQFAYMLLDHPNTYGSLAASKDEIANTSALDFAYKFPDPTNPDQYIIIQGAGEIPNSVFTITSTTAHLAVTVSNSTSFLLIHCVVTIDTFHCTLGTHKSFDLTWVNNGVGTVAEKTTSVETMGPATTKIKGSFTSKTANVNGTWGEADEPEHSTANFPGYLDDTQSTTMIREITVEPNQ